jgi:hypothetical protein
MADSSAPDSTVGGEAPPKPCVFIKKQKPALARKRADAGLIVHLSLSFACVRVLVVCADDEDDDTQITRKHRDIKGITASTKYCVCVHIALNRYLLRWCEDGVESVRTNVCM